MTAASDETRASPGEEAPLKYEDGRGPVTDEEVLAVLRRQRREQHRKGSAKHEIPDSLPPANANKEHQIFRLPPLVVARARARAEIENRNLTQIVEELLRRYSQGTPRRPRS